MYHDVYRLQCFAFLCRLDELGSVHRAHVHERDDIVSRMENCNLDINTKAGTKGGLESRYRFFQQMRGYVRDLVECLAEKVGLCYLSGRVLTVFG